MCPSANAERPKSAHANMIWIPCGTHRMGSDRHYPEEARAQRVVVDGFRIDRAPDEALAAISREHGGRRLAFMEQ
jgi:formylglycine-generating enzyme required for sulfatase activity